MTSATPANSADAAPAAACCACGDGPVDPRIARSRAKVLDAATELMVESGPRAVTVDAVSERSGVSKSTMYRHWDSRQALLVDVMRANMPDIAPPDESLPFGDALRALVRAVANELSDPHWRRILPALLSLRQQQPELDALAEDDHAGKLSVLAAIMARGAAAGDVPDDVDLELASQVLIGPVVFATLGGYERLGDVADFAVDRFLASYRSP